jgi:pimeloyl-ACP methyl ester carboxylesterase
MTITESTASRACAAPRCGKGRLRHIDKFGNGRQATGRALEGLCIALVLSALVALLFRHDMREARARLQAQPTRVFKSRYGNIEYRVSGTGPAVLISHGITGGVDQAAALVTQWRILPSEQYTFIYVSRFGYLGSELPDQATARTQAEAYRELLDHLGIERVFLVGNSAGGPSAMWFAIDHPGRTHGLILHSSAVPGPEAEYIPKFVAQHDFIYWLAVKVASEKLLGLLLPGPIIAAMTKAQKRLTVQNAFVGSMPISERTKGILFDNSVSLPGINDVPFEQIRPPTLIIQSTDDLREAVGGQEMHERIPNSTLVRLKGGHLLLGQEAEIQKVNAEFIKSHIARQAWNLSNT